MLAKLARWGKKSAGSTAAQNITASERSFEELESFAAAVSQDLKGPLHSIVGSAEALHQRYGHALDEKARHLITNILQGTNHMEQLITDLLGYAQVHADGRPFEPLNCHSILATVLFNLKTSVEKNSAVITTDALPTIAGDETQFIQLFHNLIDNAIRYRSVRPPRIHVSAHPMGDPAVQSALRSPHPVFEEGWLFSVADNGVGIEPHHAGQVFSAFHRVDREGGHAGRGVGLAVCKQIVERHGGLIWVDSAPGKGSTFYFTLP